MKKQKSSTIFISKELSSDDESQAKPHKEDLKKYIKGSDEESPKSSPQKPKFKRKKKLTKHDSPTIQTNKTISQKISKKSHPRIRIKKAS